MITEDRYKKIGGKIKEAREAMGVSQADLANSIGFSSPTAVALIESGDRKVSIERLEQIAVALQKDINFFLDGETIEVDLDSAFRASNLSDKDKKLLLDIYGLIKKDKPNGPTGK